MTLQGRFFTSGEFFHHQIPRRNCLNMPSKDSEPQGEDLGARGELDEVVGRCQAGDREAQRKLYELRHARIYTLAARMVGREEAQDLVQQIFLQLFKKIGQFAGRSQFDTWLYRLVTNEALQYLRKGKRWTFDTLAWDPASSGKSRTDRREESELLEVALGRLDPELRAVFVLKEIEELSYRDIAESVGIPEGTVGSRLNRARRELQKHLAALGWES